MGPAAFVSSLRFVVIVQAPWGDGNGVAVVTTYVTTPTVCMDSFGHERNTDVGAYFLIVNPVRRQYFDPARFGEAIKFSALLRGGHCIQALKLLLSDCFPREGTSFPGAWLGDPVVFASDDSGLPNSFGVRTATGQPPERNLHALAKAEFTDISYRALAELCRDDEIATELAGQVKDHESLLIDLGATLDQYRLPVLEVALNAAVGQPWRRGYNQAQAKLTWWHPLPPIDWPL